VAEYRKHCQNTINRRKNSKIMAMTMGKCHTHNSNLYLDLNLLTINRNPNNRTNANL